jgi:hypothetical protein
MNDFVTAIMYAKKIPEDALKAHWKALRKLFKDGGRS